MRDTKVNGFLVYTRPIANRKTASFVVMEDENKIIRKRFPYLRTDFRNKQKAFYAACEWATRNHPIKNWDDLTNLPHLGTKNPYIGKEDDLQKTVASFLELEYPYPETIWFHVPNGGARSKGEAGKMKGLGTKPGVSDILILETRGEYKGFCLELKVKKGKVSPDQYIFLYAMSERGFKTVVAYNYDVATEEIRKYLK